MIKISFYYNKLRNRWVGIFEKYKIRTLANGIAA